MDKQIVERFKLFQNTTGKFHELDIESVIFENFQYSDENYFKFIKGQNKYIQRYIRENPGEIAELGSSLENDCIANYVKPVSENDVIREECVTYNKDNAKGSRAFVRDFPFVMDRHHIAIIPNKTFIKTEYLYESLDQLLISKKYGWGDNVSSAEEIKTYSLKVPVSCNIDLTSVELQSIILDFLKFFRSKNDQQINIIQSLYKEIDEAYKIFLPLFFSKHKSIADRFDLYCQNEGVELKFNNIEFDYKRILSTEEEDIICHKRMGFTPKRVIDGNINWFTVRDLTQNKSLFIDAPNTNEKTTIDLIKSTIPDRSPKLKSISKGDVLVSFKLTVGTTKIYNSEAIAYCNEAIDILTPLNNIDSQYLAYNCQYEYPKYGTKTNNGITLNDEDKKQIVIRVPKETQSLSSFKIQKLFAAFINNYLLKLSELKSELTALQALLAEYNQSLIHKTLI